MKATTFFAAEAIWICGEGLLVNLWTYTNVTSDRQNTPHYVDQSIEIESCDENVDPFGSIIIELSSHRGNLQGL